MAATGQIHPRYNDTIGQIETANSIHWKRINQGVYWCLDNGVFTGKFNVEKWTKQMDDLKEHKDKCLFIAIPDVVGNFEATLKQFSHYRNMVKDYPVAFVSQDGIRERDIPWNDFSCLFVGGSDRHKLGKEGGLVIREAKKRGKWVHIGRVNSPARILKFWQADSWDGTHLGYMPSDVGKFHAAVLQVRAMKAQNRMFE
jgi:hypothetical protein